MPGDNILMNTQHLIVRPFAVIAAAAILLAACSPAATPAATVAPANTAAAVVEPTPAPATEAPAAVEPTPATATEAPAAAVEPTPTTEAPAAPTEAPTVAPVVELTAAPAPIVALAPTKINLNTATPDQILSAPNTGNRMVREFQEYRPYASILQFRREIGKYVDDAQVAEYEKSFYVPVSINNADAATLQQLPGVDAAVAEQLIAARPFADSAAFLAKLSALSSPENAAAAGGYLEAP